MPRTQKYDVTGSLGTSQPTIVTQFNNNNVGLPPKPDTNSVSERKTKCCSGWCAASIFGALCLTFVLCMAHLRIPGISFERYHHSSKLLQKRGQFRLYPNLQKHSSLPGVYNIYLPLNHSVSEQLEDVINGYPEYTELYTPCFVDLSTYDHPCYFDKTWLKSQCHKNDDFGWDEVNGTYSPCILIQISDTLDWRPYVYSEKVVSSSWKQVYDPTFSSIGCAVKSKEHKNNIQSIEVAPEKGFPNHFFPVSNFNTTTYLTPSVIIRFKGIKVGETVTVECWLRVTNAYILKDNGQLTFTFHQKKQKINKQGQTSEQKQTISSTVNTNSTQASTEFLQNSTLNESKTSTTRRQFDFRLTA